MSVQVLSINTGVYLTPFLLVFVMRLSYDNPVQDASDACDTDVAKPYIFPSECKMQEVCYDHVTTGTKNQGYVQALRFFRHAEKSEERG